MSKRTLLVTYASSDEELEDKPPPKKRKLPILAETVKVPVPIDNPALHQGRIRSSPHVEGQWASFVYIPVVLGRDEYLAKLLTRIFDAAKQQAPSLQSIGLEDGQWELHMSLTRPTFLRTHQKEDFKRAVKNLTRSEKRFSVSFAKLTQLTNDEQTRVFLTVEVGAGFDQLQYLTQALVPVLRAIKQQEFYSEPRFHVSIAWALLARENPGHNSASVAVEEFATISELPPDLIPDLNQKYSSGLQKPISSLEVEHVRVKIGKEISGWDLAA